MFESILPHHAGVVATLQQQILEGSLPHALLLAGPPFAGRLTLAYEIARVVTCRKEGEATCLCPSCRTYYRSAPTNLIFVGNREHKIRVSGALNAFKEELTKRRLNQLLFVVRAMISQYHPALEGEGVGELDQLLIQLEDLPQEEYGRGEKELRAQLKPFLAPTKRSPGLTIDMVRLLQQWSRLTSLSGEARFIVLEGVERGSIGSQNSLLKLLEEPPVATYIILISERPALLLPTILSRVQHYQLEELKGVGELTYQWANIATEELKGEAKAFLGRKLLTHRELASLCGKLDEDVLFNYFKEALIEEVRGQFKANLLSSRQSSHLVGRIEEAFAKGALYNQSNRVVVESLYYRLREE
ncbi:MAG: hypothetical protein ACOXZ2_07485 [Sphaerochaetaceae bacterium]|jgi:DNA polymerase III delta prime subunit|nr:hypothetical protein [Sphaerochaetaceae bacterium]HHU88928.1 hypothetical protein [Spirochaetales bacterium]